jgi:hypothetical protein
MNKHEIQPFVGRGCFKVYEMFYISKLKNVNFHTFETFEEENVIQCICSCVIFQFIQQLVNPAMEIKKMPTMLLAQVIDVASKNEHEHSPIKIIATKYNLNVFNKCCGESSFISIVVHCGFSYTMIVGSITRHH